MSAIEGSNVNLSADEEGKTNLTMQDLLQFARPTATASEYIFAVFGLKPERLTGQKVLDVGAGGSDATATLAQFGVDAYALDPRYVDLKALEQEIFELQGIDHEAENLALGRFLESVNQDPSRYIAGSATNIPFKDNTFDLVISKAAIMFHLDFDSGVLNEAIEECLRVTKPGGSIRLHPLMHREEEVPEFVNELRLNNEARKIMALQVDTRIAQVGKLAFADGTESLFIQKA